MTIGRKKSCDWVGLQNYVPVDLKDWLDREALNYFFSERELTL